MARCETDAACESRRCATGGPEGGRCAPMQATQAPCNSERDCPLGQFCWLPNVTDLFPRPNFGMICADPQDPRR
jgi:hypothetical protein